LHGEDLDVSIITLSCSLICGWMDHNGQFADSFGAIDLTGIQ
jgi:hypothetical protein